MNQKLKTAVIVLIIAVVGFIAFCGFGYARQKIVSNEGIELLKDKEYQSAYEKFHEASGKFTLLWTNQKTQTLFYEAESLYRLEKYREAIDVYNELKEHGDYRAYPFIAYCYMGLDQENNALAICDEGIREYPKAGDIYCAKYGIYARKKQYKEGLAVLETAINTAGLESKNNVLLSRISAYESLFDFDTAYKYAKEYVKAYPKDEQGQKELEFLETR